MLVMKHLDYKSYEYKLRGKEAAATYTRENKKYALAAGARGGSTFSGASDATKANIIAAQGGALQGVPA